MAGMTKGKLSASILGAVILAAALFPGYHHRVQLGKAGRGSKDTAALEQARNIAASLPLAFEPNRGQTDGRVQFLARSAGYEVFLTSASSATMEFKGAPDNTHGDKTHEDQIHLVTMNLLGANGAATPQPEAKLKGVSNYYIGNDQTKWIAGIPNYSRVRYDGLYPGIAAVYQGDNLQFRYDFEVAPGADPQAIRWSYDHAADVGVDPQGVLVVSTSDGARIASSKPYIYQEFGGVKHPVEGGYHVSGNQVSFEIARYDSSKPLVIDPSLSNGTLLGATGAQVGDTVLSSVVNRGSGIYVTGYTLSANFPTKNAYQGTPSGNTDVVVAELSFTMANVTGDPVFSTYLGGTGADSGTAIALDSGGNAIVVGTTQSGAGFPSMNPLVPFSPPLSKNAFIAKLSSAGALLNSSQIWGTGATLGLGVAVQAGANNIAITGSSTSSDLLTTIGAPATAYQTANNSTLPGPNAFVIDLSDSPTGPLAVLYASYFGGHNSDIGNAVAWDPTTGDLVVAGSSTSFNGTTAGSLFQSAAAAPHTALQITEPGTHGFIAKFNPAASGSTSLVFSQAIGNNTGSGFETLTAVAVDALGNNYVAGNMSEVNPATEKNFTSPALLMDGVGTAGGSAQDGFVIELAPGGGTAVYGTVVTGDEVSGNNGGTVANAITNVTGIAVDGLGQAYISGFVTNSIITPATGYAIRRRINKNGFIVGGTPFLTDFTFTPGQAGAVTAVGDIVLRAGTLAQAPFGASNAISVDSTTNNVCVAGYLNQATLPTAGTTPIIVSSALQPTGPVAPNKTGLIVCNTFDSDTLIVSSNFSSPNTFLFTLADGGNASTPVSQSFSAVNNDQTITASSFTISPVDGSGQILASQYAPATTTALRWLNIVKSGVQVTMNINTAIAGTFDPGLYSVTFSVTPNQGDNAGVPQTLTVQLSVTGILNEDTTVGGGKLLSTEGAGGVIGLPSYGSAVSCVDATLTCTLSIVQGASTFPDGNATETFTIPLVSVAQHSNPSAGNIELTELESNGSASPDFINFDDLTTGPNGVPGCNGAATANACAVTVRINAATFVHMKSQTYTDTFQVYVAGTTPNPPKGILGGAALNPTGFTQVPNPQVVTFVVNVGAGGFFTGEVGLGSNVYYLAFPDSIVFGYYTFVSSTIFYHYAMGYEAFVAGSSSDAYLYDFTSKHWWYTSTTLFPYIYDFSLGAWIYYFPDTQNPGHYSTNPRYFSNLTTGQIFMM